MSRQIFIYIALFVAVILVFLWIMQNVFLGLFYELGVRKTMKNCADKITENVVTDFSSEMERYDMSIIVFDRLGNVVESSSYFRNSYLENISPYMRTYLYQMTYENGGERYLRILDQNQLHDAEQKDFERPIRMLYTRISQNDDNLILVEAILSPVNATAEALRVQLTWSSILFLILAAIFAAMISRKISRPLVKINHSAKQLAKGNYHADFNVTGSIEINELADTLDTAAKELSRVDDLRKELLANISHDLRTPLTMITAYAEMMRDLPGEQTPENVQVIIDEANRLNLLVGDLLDLSKLQSGAHNLTKIRFNLTECLRKLMDRYNKLIEQEDYDIRFSFDREVYVYADELKITQAAYNLINNAVNYTGDDKRVDVNQTTENGIVRIEIVDTGDGIPQEKLQYIWDRYYRASDNRHHREKNGSGIGLSIVKEVMELHGAHYGVKSIPGEGSIFWFELQVSK